MKLKKHISSLLFAFAVFGGMGHAQDYKEINTTFTYDPAKLTSEAGAREVMGELTRQSRNACRSVSMVSVGFTVDESCAADLLGQAVAQINDDNLMAQYAAIDFEGADS